MKQLFVYQHGNAFTIYSAKERTGETFIRTVEAPVDADEEKAARKWFLARRFDAKGHDAKRKASEIVWLDDGPAEPQE